MNAATPLLIVMRHLGNWMRQVSHLAALIAWVTCSSAVAQAAPALPMQFSHVSLEDWLSQNNVQSILQD